MRVLRQLTSITRPSTSPDSTQSPATERLVGEQREARQLDPAQRVLQRETTPPGRSPRAPSAPTRGRRPRPRRAATHAVTRMIAEPGHRQEAAGAPNADSRRVADDRRHDARDHHRERRQRRAPRSAISSAAPQQAQRRGCPEPTSNSVRHAAATQAARGTTHTRTVATAGLQAGVALPAQPFLRGFAGADDRARAAPRSRSPPPGRSRPPNEVDHVDCLRSARQRRARASITPSRSVRPRVGTSTPARDRALLRDQHCAANAPRSAPGRPPAGPSPPTCRVISRLPHRSARR